MWRLSTSRIRHRIRRFIDSKDEQEMLLQFVRDVGAGDLTKGWSEGVARLKSGLLGAACE
jgi:hypothetical protein